VETLADTLLRVWQARPDEHQGEISREAYVELVLTIASISDLLPNLREDWPPVSRIYKWLESSDVEQVGMTNVEDSPVLEVAPGKPQKNKDGWRPTRTSYRLHPANREELLAVLKWGDPAELAAAVEEAVIEDLRKRVNRERMGLREEWEARSYTEARRESLKSLVGFFSLGHQNAPGAERTEDGRRVGKEEVGEEEVGEERSGIKESKEGGKDEEENQGARKPRGKPADGAYTASNGCYIGSSETPSNRRSERSDREKRGGYKLSKPPSTGSITKGSITNRDLGSFYQPKREEFEARGTRKQRRLLDERARLPAERLLFLHLLGESKKASYSAAGEDEWTTVPAETLEQEMGAPYHSTYRVWRGSDLVEAYDKGFYVPPNDDDVHPRAREFRIPDSVMERWNALAGGSKRYWLHTEEPERTAEAQPLSTSLSDENNNALPELVDRALRVLQDADHPIRTAPVEEAISRLSARDSQEGNAQKVGLQFALETIERQATGSEEGVAWLKNAYEMTFGGRILFKNGGPQGLMGAVKSSAYDIEGLRNYDIKSCHTSALRQVADKLAEAGVDVDVSPWEEYPGKDTVVERTGLPRTLVKITEHAIKYGAYLPKSIAQAEAVFTDTPIDAGQLQLVKAAKKYAEGPDEALGKLHDVFADMRRVVKKISKALLNEYYDATKRGGYMHNACGVSFNPRNYDEGHERQTKVMAWMLQGLEAAFVHSITILGTESDDYDVVANEHDGCIVKGEIPQEAIEAARHMSGFRRAELAEKPFADEEDIREIYGGEESEEPEGNSPGPGQSPPPRENVFEPDFVEEDRPARPPVGPQDVEEDQPARPPENMMGLGPPPEPIEEDQPARPDVAGSGAGAEEPDRSEG
jgi:hypothetical protein